MQRGKIFAREEADVNIDSRAYGRRRLRMETGNR